ncbi:MAG: hypothetical protein LBR77_06060 [Lachnospiraceae bacterium]|nr:hypothetical protein [Lachnospiraceae bacterium]
MIISPAHRPLMHAQSESAGTSPAAMMSLGFVEMTLRFIDWAGGRS